MLIEEYQITQKFGFIDDEINFAKFMPRNHKKSHNTLSLNNVELKYDSYVKTAYHYE